MLFQNTTWAGSIPSLLRNEDVGAHDVLHVSRQQDLASSQPGPREQLEVVVLVHPNTQIAAIGVPVEAEEEAACSAPSELVSEGEDHQSAIRSTVRSPVPVRRVRTAVQRGEEESAGLRGVVGVQAEGDGVVVSVGRQTDRGELRLVQRQMSGESELHSLAQSLRLLPDQVVATAAESLALHEEMWLVVE